MKNYVVFDLETPNRTNNSISSVALLIVKNNKVVKSISQLINPESYFEQFNINLTGITPEDVENSPTFEEYWPTISDYLTSNMVVGHNVQFDLRTVSRVLNHYDMEIPEFDYCCTLFLSRKHFNLNSYRLTNVSKHIKFDYNPHIAIEDAKASYEILEYINKENEIDSNDCRHYHYRLKFEKAYDEYLATNLNELYGMLYLLRYYKSISPSQVELLKKWHEENKNYDDTTVFNNLNKMFGEIFHKKVITPMDIKFLLTRTPPILNSTIYSEKTLHLQILRGMVEVIMSDNSVDEYTLNILYDWLLEGNILKGNYIYDNILQIIKSSLEGDVVDCNSQNELFELFDNFLIINSKRDVDFDFENKTYCLTGEFEHGTKDDIEYVLDGYSLVRKNSLSYDVNYLFVGNLGNPSWKNGKMGEKIFEAKKLVYKNSNLIIINEELLFDKLDIL